MESLSALLERISELEKDLTSEYVSQSEVGHFDTSGPGKSYDKEQIWVVDQEAVISPDYEKIGKARFELKQICDSSDWYTARYYAARALEKNSEELTQLISSWTPTLEKLIIAEPETDL